MAPKGSSSSSSARRPSTRKPRKKETLPAEVDQSIPATEAAADDLDFGAGIVEEETASPPPPARERPARTSRARSERAPRAERAPAPEVEVEKFVEPPVAQERVIDIDEVDFDDDFDDAEGASSSAGSDDRSSEGQGDSADGPSEGGEQRPRRRRRRRGRRNEGGNPQGGQGEFQNSRNQNQQGYGQHRNQGNNQGRRREQPQQGNRRGGHGNAQGQNSGNNRGRRMSKFEQNAAPAAPVATSGHIEGVLELHPKGYGFLRSADNDYGARETDAFVSSSFVEKHQLREGIKIRGEIGPGTRGQGPRLLTIDSIDGGSVEDYEKLKHFDTLTAINPFEQIKLETGPRPITMRVMDLLTPIGKGQRALIVAPPRTGKTMLLQDIANSVSENHPEIHLIVLLIDERPEEVTEMRRTIKGEVIASSMDLDVESHVRISQLIFERGKRLAESGKDCFILMDSITRTARAFNKWVRGGRDSKIQTGGLDVRAMDIPRKMFGTARRFDEGGSLTVCATALIDTGSRMDDAIFQEFKGTGNMELVLSRDLADRRIWPALDISRSGTRREEKILDPEILDGIIMLRRSLVSMNPTEAMDQLVRTLGKFDTNREFLQKIRAVL
ncbi:transcription termination factor Rho [Planctomicrobium sp. SH664]|uniref:transcription termination factor Rho n=1 Tax=Planctomicrobium sp. SH664 TaxID=3448125 RepID=UPI003F5BD2CC